MLLHASRRSLLPLRRWKLLLLLGVGRARAVHRRVALTRRAVGEARRRLIRLLLLLLLLLLRVARWPLRLAWRCAVGLAA